MSESAVAPKTSPAALPPAFRMLPLADVREAPHNPRKHFEAGSLQELTDSVRAKGVLQPILVRPKAAGYEVVCGARRLRAAKAAALAEIPAVVRELTDAEALESAVIENLQRADVHHLEEAEGYEQLMKLHKHTADDLAAKVGKSRAYVYARLKLLALSPAGRKAFYAGDLNSSTALLVARIPSHSLQDKALQEITSKDYRGEVFSVRLAAEHIQRSYMLRLKEAPFATKDAKLLPKAGACSDCPKRTGNQPDLFADVGSADVCTDPACFQAKREAHYAIARAKAEADGREVISGKAAKAIAPHGSIGNGYLAAKEKEAFIAGNWIDIPQALKKLSDVTVHLLELPTSREIVEVVETKALAAAMKKAGLIDTPTATRMSKSGDTNAAYRKKQQADDAKREAAIELETGIRRRILDAIRGKITAGSPITREDGAAVLESLWDYATDGDAYDEVDRLLETYGWTDPPDPKSKVRPSAHDIGFKRIAALEIAELWRVMIDMALLDDVVVYSYGKPSDPKKLLAAAQRHGVDHAAIRAELTAATKEQAAAAAAEQKAKAGKTKKPAKGKS